MWDVQFMGFSLYQLMWYFAAYALLGWCVEVVFCTLNTGKFVNRGFLNGPVCPIYGFGMVIMLVCLTPLKDNLLVLFLGTVVLTSLLELVTGWCLKKLFHTSWWDYSDTPFNLGGYICLKFSILWGVGGVAAVQLVHPLVAGLIDLLPPLAGKILISVILCLFVADLIVTVSVIAHFNRDLGELQKVAAELHKTSEALAQRLGDAALELEEKHGPQLAALAEKADAAIDDVKVRADDVLDEVRSKLAEAADQRAGRRDARREELAELAERLSSRKAALLNKRGVLRGRMLHAFPRMKNLRDSEAFTAMREQDTARRSKK